MTLVYECDGEETKFTRSIKKDGVGEYRIDGKACKWEAYSARLKSLGVLTSAHTGFLVFQGFVTELATKAPMELTKLFEEISGSAEYKADYERLEKEKKQASCPSPPCQTARPAATPLVPASPRPPRPRRTRCSTTRRRRASRRRRTT